MARSVSLSDEAFHALREEKQPRESDSDVVIRLRNEARTKRKDPFRFLRNKIPFELGPEEHLDFLDRMRKADVERSRRT